MVIQKTPVKIDKIVSLQIGQHQENVATQVKMDVSDWITAHPNAGFHVLFKRPGEVQAQPVLSSLDGGVLSWEVGAWETENIGVGYAEVRAVDGTKALVAKSRVIPCSVERSVVADGGVVPPAFQGWVNVVLAAKDAVVAAAQGMSNIVLVQDEQPSDEANKVWFDSDSDNEIEVPTMGDLNAAAAGGPETIAKVAKLEEALTVKKTVTQEITNVDTVTVTVPVYVLAGNEIHAKVSGPSISGEVTITYRAAFNPGGGSSDWSHSWQEPTPTSEIEDSTTLDFNCSAVVFSIPFRELGQATFEVILPTPIDSLAAQTDMIQQDTDQIKINVAQSSYFTGEWVKTRSVNAESGGSWSTEAVFTLDNAISEVLLQYRGQNANKIQAKLYQEPTSETPFETFNNMRTSASGSVDVIVASNLGLFKKMVVSVYNTIQGQSNVSISVGIPLLNQKIKELEERLDSLES